jgi:mannose/fructose-specific phosphotransferase system component IIA
VSLVHGIVVTHGRLGEALVEAAEEITGTTDALTALSNQGVNPESLRRSVEEAIGEGPALVFVDLGSGSCGFAASTASRACQSAAVVTGVSLPMLIDFLFNRELDPFDLADRLVLKGRSSINSVSPRRSDDDARSVSD